MYSDMLDKQQASYLYTNVQHAVDRMAALRRSMRPRIGRDLEDQARLVLKGSSFDAGEEGDGQES